MHQVFHIDQLLNRHLRWRLSLFLVAGVATLVVACGGGSDSPDGAAPTPAGSDEAPVAQAPTDPTPTTESTATPVPTPSTADPEPTVDTVSPSEDEATPEPTVKPTVEINIGDDTEAARAERLRLIWKWDTNFNERNISLNDVKIVLPRDQIVPIDEPKFVPVTEAPAYMKPREPVVAVVVNGEAKAYSLAMLMWHEIVNDTIGGLPVTVTFCPLCNTGITFERVVDGQELTFGTSGMLRNSDLVMWDRQTQSWWQQITGEALVGDFAANDTVLKFVPSSIIAWETFVDAYPDGQVLTRVFSAGQPLRPYDSPPYAGYDNIDDRPFLFTGTLDDRLVATSRVLTIDGEISVAYPFAFLEETPVLNDSVNGVALTAFFDDGTLSAFKDQFNADQAVGSVAVFSRTIGDRTLTFELTESGITDTETGSTWNLAGIAVSGELEGTQLSPVVHANHFWFAWAVFKPETVIRDSVEDLTT